MPETGYRPPPSLEELKKSFDAVVARGGRPQVWLIHGLLWYEHREMRWFHVFDPDAELVAVVFVDKLEERLGYGKRIWEG